MTVVFCQIEIIHDSSKSSMQKFLSATAYSVPSIHALFSYFDKTSQLPKSNYFGQGQGLCRRLLVVKKKECRDFYMGFDFW